MMQPTPLFLQLRKIPASSNKQLMTSIEYAVTAAYLTLAGKNANVDVSPNRKALHAYTDHRGTYRNKRKPINRNHHPTMQPSPRSH